MSAAQFADSFAKYTDYQAEVGMPGRIDAGAGQRYVEVPVRIHGTLRDGKRPFASRETLTLHRTGDIDGATAAQRNWRMRASSLPPIPVDIAGKSAPIVAHYRCAERPGSASASTTPAIRDGAARRPRSGSARRAAPSVGHLVQGGGYELRGKGDDADFTAPGKPPVACTAAR